MPYAGYGPHFGWVAYSSIKLQVTKRIQEGLICKTMDLSEITENINLHYRREHVYNLVPLSLYKNIKNTFYLDKFSIQLPLVIWQ